MGTMKDLDKKRDDHGKKEISQVKLLAKLQEHKQARFRTALASQSLLENQFNNDSQIIFTKLMDWHSKAKNDKQEDTLWQMIQALWRIQTHHENIKTQAKAAISEWLTEKDMHCRSVSKVYELEKTIKALKAEIKYYENEQRN